MYSQFSAFYDILMNDADYKNRAEYIKHLFEKFGAFPTLMLDLACGTGAFSNEFARDNVSVIGVDCSPEMLSIARENSGKQGYDVLYLCQRADELDLYGTVDGAICCLDSINHITDYEELSNAFKKVSLFLEEDKLFIFDVNTPYKHEKVLADNTFVIEEDNLFCVWDNNYDEDTKITNINLDFFLCDDDGKYERKSDYIEERAYTQDEISKALLAAEFKIEAIYGDFTEEAPKADTERAVYVARKVTKK